MNMKNVHTVPWQGRWTNKRPFQIQVRKTYRQKSDAVKAGRATARNARSEHFIHARDGRILYRNSYGPDLRSDRG